MTTTWPGPATSRHRGTQGQGQGHPGPRRRPAHTPHPFIPSLVYCLPRCLYQDGIAHTVCVHCVLSSSSHNITTQSHSCVSQSNVTQGVPAPQAQHSTPGTQLSVVLTVTARHQQGQARPGQARPGVPPRPGTQAWGGEAPRGCVGVWATTQQWLHAGKPPSQQTRPGEDH